MAEPRQERAIRTKAAIIRAAAVVFDRQGYDVASIAEILSEADVTRGALYFHFPSKEVLARAVIDAQTTLVRPRKNDIHVQSAIDVSFDVAAALQGNPVMRAAIRLTIERGSWKETEAAPYLGWVELLETPLRQARERDELLPHVDPRRAAELLVGSFTGVQLLSEVLSRRADLLERITELWTFMLPGLVAPGFLTRLRTVPLAVLDPAPLRTAQPVS